MWYRNRSFRGLALTAAAVLIAPAALADVVELEPMKDNTLIEDADGDRSNGAGPGVFAGRVSSSGNGLRRRAVIAWDVASVVPAGATVTNVTLTMTCVAANNFDDAEITLHRLLQDWGEAGSSSSGGSGAPAQPGDATWLNTFYPNEDWNTVGGDFVETVSGSAIVSSPVPYTWESTPQMVADVQGWLDDPATNFGWLARGDESMPATVKRFGSSEEIEGFRPVLTVTYELAAPSPDFNDDGVVNARDLATLLAAWGPCDGCPEDLNQDGAVDASDLAILLAAWG